MDSMVAPGMNYAREMPSRVKSLDMLDVVGFCKEVRVDKLLRSMEQQGSVATEDTYKHLLLACSKKKALADAKLVHMHLAKNGLVLNGLLGELMVTTLVNCGGFGDGLQLFQRLRHRTAVSWTAIISGYSNAGQCREALSCYEQMKQEHVQPNKYTLVSLLKACSRLEDLEEAKRMHADALRYGFESNMFVGNTLVSMYAKCGSVLDAQHVFDRLCRRDVVSWNAMLAAYAQRNQGEQALQLYGQMKMEGIRPDARTFVSTLQACGILAQKEESTLLGGQRLKAVAFQEGKEIHGDVRANGFELDVFVGNALVSMYSKCGSLTYAQKVFDKLVEPNVVSWTGMIAAYAQQDEGDKALQIFWQMQEEGVRPDARTFATALQACGMLAEKEKSTLVDGLNLKVDSLRYSRELHAAATERGFEFDVFVGSALVSTYAKCRSVLDAQEVFDRLPHHNVVSWSALVAAYAHQGEGEKALQSFQRMQEAHVTLDARAFVSAVQACGTLAEKEESEYVAGQVVKVELLQRVKSLDAEAAGRGFDSDFFLGSTLVSVYGKCGSTRDAQWAFDRMPQKSVVLWNALIAAYAQQDRGEKALGIFEQMLHEGISPNARTFVSLLQACGTLAEEEEGELVDGRNVKLQALHKGIQIHADAVNRGLGSDMFIGSTLVSMYAKCGSTMIAQKVFDTLPLRDVVSWTAIIGAYAQQDQGEQALQSFRQMQQEGMRPDARTLVSALQACGTLAEKEETVLLMGESVKVESLRIGEELHAEAKSLGCDSDIFVANSLVSMYAKCGKIADAQHVFHSLPRRDVVSWTAMIAAYAQRAQGELALQLYQQMHDEGVKPDGRTFVGVLQACGSMAEMEYSAFLDGQYVKVESLQRGQGLHVEAVSMGLESDIFVGNTLVSMYAKCGSIKDAEQVFNRLSNRNVVSWTAMISAYAQQDQGGKALQLYAKMEAEGLKPHEGTFLAVLEACSNTGALDICIQTHHKILDGGYGSNSSVAACLIHTYSKCGSMVDAQLVFDSLPQPDVVAWTALIAGYARVGGCEMSMQCYEKMCLAGIKPNRLSFLALLSACSHAGMVEKGLGYFESMNRDHGVLPELEHYACVIDLVGRAGLLSKAANLLCQMPMAPDLAVWLCLLDACRKHGNLELGRQAFDGAISIEPREGAAYVVMSSIYAHAGFWNSAKEIDTLRQRAGAWKKPGQSWIEHEQQVHTFLVGDQRHEQQAEIYELLRTLG